jgi:para-aminobenzoate synthetase component 1
VIDFDPDCVRIQGDNVDKVVSLIQAFVPPANPVTFESAPLVQGRVTPDEYAANVRRIQDYILTGDVYELSYCIEFFLENARLNPMATYQSLNARSPMPFSGFLKWVIAT